MCHASLLITELELPFFSNPESILSIWRIDYHFFIPDLKSTTFGQKPKQTELVSPKLMRAFEVQPHGPLQGSVWMLQEVKVICGI